MRIRTPRAAALSPGADGYGSADAGGRDRADLSRAANLALRHGPSLGGCTAAELRGWPRRDREAVLADLSAERELDQSEYAGRSGAVGAVCDGGDLRAVGDGKRRAGSE